MNSQTLLFHINLGLIGFICAAGLGHGLWACSAASPPPADDGEPGLAVNVTPPALRAVASSKTEDCGDPFANAGTLRFKTDGWKTDFCKHEVPYAEIRGGGPPRDGIPPIDDPKFVSVAAADSWLGSREPVIAYEHAGVARAYPLQILTWHEVVNDRIGGRDVAVTFCPLCYAAIVFERPLIDGKRLTFGTSGNLRNSDLVMWDRETESWWQQFEGRAIVGELTGTELVQLPANIVSWADFKSNHPKGEVLSKDTGHKRAYGKNPYVGYDDINKKPFLYEGKVDGKRPPMAHVIGVIIGKEKRAYGLAELMKSKLAQDNIGSTPIAVLWRPGVSSALDGESIADSKDIGVTGVFDRRVDGVTLSLKTSSGGNYQDTETGSTWNVHGRAIAGKLQGKRLTPLPHHNVFWFVWSAFVL